MLEASGALRETAEVKANNTPNPSVGSVRVVEVEGEGHVFAACRETERLIGGSCEGKAEENRPSAFSASDTIGARWSCSADRSWEPVKAFALCALVAAPEAATATEP